MRPLSWQQQELQVHGLAATAAAGADADCVYSDRPGLCGQFGSCVALHRVLVQYSISSLGSCVTHTTVQHDAWSSTESWA
jgi:hypothetical protein